MSEGELGWHLTSDDPWARSDLGGPRQITAHLFHTTEFSGFEQHLGSITFPDYFTDLEPYEYCALDNPFEVATKINNWVNQMRVLSEGVLGEGLAVVGRDDPFPTRSVQPGDGLRWACRSRNSRDVSAIWEALIDIRGLNKPARRGSSPVG